MCGSIEGFLSLDVFDADGRDAKRRTFLVFEARFYPLASRQQTSAMQILQKYGLGSSWHEHVVLLETYSLIAVFCSTIIF